MIKRTHVAIISLIVLAGCAAQRQLTREEWLATTTKEYEGITSEQIFAASERLFRLADGDDFQFSHTDDALYATRPWSFYVVLAAGFGTDYWRVHAVRTAKGTRVSVQISTQHQAVTPTPTSSPGVWSAGTSPMAGAPVQGTAIYDVFWGRMDYLLGKRSDWMNCKIADDRVSKGVVFGNNEALCNSFNIVDETPKEPLFKP